MTSLHRRCALALALTAATAAAGQGEAGEPPAPPNCGVNSIWALASALGRPTSPAQFARLVAQYPQAEVSLLDISGMAEQLGMAMEGFTVTAQELEVSGQGGIVHLTDPDHFAAYLGCDGKYVQLADGPGLELTVCSLEEFARRFSGRCLLSPSAFDAAPAVKVDVRHAPLGEATVGSELEHLFTIKNGGRVPLELRVTGSSCSCTLTANETLNVPPGEEVDVPVTVRLRLIGEQVQHLRLSTSDPAAPVLFLTLSATGLQGIHAAPRTILLRALRGESDTATVRISTPVGVSVTSARCEPELCEVTPRGTVPEEQRWLRSLELRLRDDLPAGEHTARLIIATNQPDGAPLSLPVRVSVVPVLQAFPARLADFHVGTDGALFTLRLTARDGRAFAIETCDVAGDGFALLDVTPRPEGGYLIRLRGRPERGAWIRGTLAVETDLPGETLAVPLLVEGAP